MPKKKTKLGIAKVYFGGQFLGTLESDLTITKKDGTKTVYHATIMREFCAFNPHNPDEQAFAE